MLFYFLTSNENHKRKNDFHFSLKTVLTLKKQKTFFLSAGLLEFYRQNIFFCTVASLLMPDLLNLFPDAGPLPIYNGKLLKESFLYLIKLAV